MNSLCTTTGFTLLMTITCLWSHALFSFSARIVLGESQDLPRITLLKVQTSLSINRLYLQKNYNIVDHIMNFLSLTFNCIWMK